MSTNLGSTTMRNVPDVGLAGDDVYVVDNGGNLINLLAPPVVKPLLINAGFTLTGETCPPTNGVIDPGETVSVSLALQNIGTANTTNLVVTLLVTNGVASPGAPQNYGAII